MYKVFVNDKPLFLTNEVQKETDFKLFLLESVDIKKLIVKIFQHKIQKAFLYHPDEKLIMKTLRAKLPVEKAGGGEKKAIRPTFIDLGARERKAIVVTQPKRETAQSRNKYRAIQNDRVAPMLDANETKSSPQPKPKTPPQ
jgi:hypothetical protein